jgi:hypothetical protein
MHDIKLRNLWNLGEKMWRTKNFGQNRIEVSVVRGARTKL